MSGLKVTIPTVFSDSSLPLLLADPALPPQGSGALLLVDPSHPANPWPAGVPADGAALPNIVWDLAAAAIGSGSQASLSPIMKRGGLANGTYNDLTGVFGKIERTARGGLHGIVSQTHGDGATGRVSTGLKIPDAIGTYVHANPTHSYFMSLWGRKTRAAINRAGFPRTLVQIGATNQTSANFAILLTDLPSQLGASSQLGSSLPSTADTTLAAFLYNVGWGAESNGNPPWAGGVQALGPQWDTATVENSYTYTNGQIPSWIFYRLYLEDLTVSGRTYAQASAADSAAYTAAFASGGRYYQTGETFTDPATIT